MGIVSAVQHAARKVGMTAAEQFWYILGCVAFGAAYLQKVPVKKALSDYGLVEMTGAENFWYILGCIFFGGAYLAKVPVAKALSELEQFQAARSAPRNQLATHDRSAVARGHDERQALPQQHSESSEPGPEEQREQ